jgi:uncharacterized protein YkwD
MASIRLTNALLASTLLIAVNTGSAQAQSINHQIALPSNLSWCDDTQINGLLTEINNVRAQRSLPALRMDAVGMKVAELRAVQFIDYMNTHTQGTPGFNPHEGYDTTAASQGYDLISENLAYSSNGPAYVVWGLWQDPLHLAAMTSLAANVAGVSCVVSGGLPYWTYEPGVAGTVTPPPTTNPPTTNPPPSGTPTLDTDQWTFLTLINQYRAQNGAGPLQVSSTLQNASQWMSADMQAKGYFSHTDSLGRSSGQRIAAFGYTSYTWGENIAAGFSDAQSVLEGWKNACDPDASGRCTYAHRVNMLNPGFAAIGIGKAGVYWTTDFGGTVDSVVQPPSGGGTGGGTGGGQTAPSIAAFSASPSTINQGSSATLSWSVSYATTVSIDNGVGNASGSSVTVNPSQTTTYRLTATNAAGSATATATITVNAVNNVDTQPPTAPAITQAAATSSTAITIAWSASSDNVGVRGYQVLRNGAAVANTASLGFTDSNLSPGANYTYQVRAYDAAGNYSAWSNSQQVTTPAVPGGNTGSCPGPASNAFTACYYSNVDLAGGPAIVRTDAQINFDWGVNKPDPSLPDAYSVRWQGRFTFQNAEYTFVAVTSDGMRISIDGELILDRWRDQAGSMYTVRRTLTAGEHLIVVEYYERSGLAVAKLNWQSNGGGTSQPPSILFFGANPGTIQPGQSTTLSWNISGASSISIDNGIGNVSGGSITVNPSQTTTYRITATNSGGSVSALATVTVSTGGGSGCPDPASDAFTGCYYNNTDMTGAPVVKRTDPAINFNWGTGTPDPAVTPYNFSVRWQGYFNFEGGSYTFYATASDGMRILIDGETILDRWRDQAASMYRINRTISPGRHLITVEYYGRSGLPTAQLSWQKTN